MISLTHNDLHPSHERIPLFSFDNYEAYKVTEEFYEEIIEGLTHGFLHDNPLSEAERKHLSLDYEVVRKYSESAVLEAVNTDRAYMLFEKGKPSILLAYGSWYWADQPPQIYMPDCWDAAVQMET